MSDLARVLVDELAGDPVALERLRNLVGSPPPTEAEARVSAYTPATLAAELGRSPRAIRGAIARGELDAIKRGRGYVISVDAVAAWANARPRARNSAAPRPRPGTGPMRRALGRLTQPALPADYSLQTQQSGRRRANGPPHGPPGGNPDERPQP